MYHSIVEERMNTVRHNEGLSDSDCQNHSEDLVVMYESFLSLAYPRTRRICQNRLRWLLLEYGIYPKSEDMRRVVEAFFVKQDTDCNNMINFTETLAVVDGVRDAMRTKAQPELKRMFDSFDKDHSSQLDMAEVSRLIEHLGLMPRCREDQADLRRLLDQIDEDGSGEIGYEEFQMLVEHIVERENASIRRRVRKVAMELGFIDKHVAELRDAFQSLDHNGDGLLTIHELRAALDLLGKQMPPDELHFLIASLDTEGWGGLNFERFLHFIRAVRGS